MPSEEVREYVREHPEEFEKVAKACDDALKERLLEVLEEEAR